MFGHGHGATFEEVSFLRECKAIVVPDGYETIIPEGMMGFVTQVLGGHYTLQMATGILVRVDGQDADAIGKEPPEPPILKTGADGRVVVDEDAVWEQLKLCFDPEIPVNIVDLGLVYECDVQTLPPAPEAEPHYKVDVVMTLTAPGCGMGQVLRDDVEYRVRSIPGVTETHVELVFDPPWGPDRMSEVARLELGFG